MIGKLVYPALLLLAVVAGFNSSAVILSFTLILLISIRIMCLRNIRIIFWSIALPGLFYIRQTLLHTEPSAETSVEVEQIVISVKETSFKVDGDKVTFEGSINERDEEVIVNYYIHSENEKNELIDTSPREVLVEGTFSVPNEPSNFYQFNYRKFLENKNIVRVFNASSLRGIKLTKPIGHPLYRLDSFRQTIISNIDRTMSGPTASYTKILLFADKRSLSNDVMQSFKELGIVHLLSISGLHIVLIIEMLTHVCRKLRISKESTHILLLIFLPFYGITTGMGVSVFRAIGQTWIKILSKKLNRPLTPLDCWSLILVITLYIRPRSIYSVGFQLSYLISFTIIMFSHQSFYAKWSRIKAYSLLNVMLLLISIPVLTYHFYEFSWGVLILNGLFIPFTAVFLLPLIIVNYILSLMIPGSIVFNYGLTLSNTMIEWMELIVNKIASNISFTFITGRLSPVIYVLLFCLITALLLILEKPEKNSPQNIIIVPLTGIMLCLASVRYTPYGQVLMIDVNQGEAILIREPWGKGNYLIDTGGQIQFPVEEWKKRDKEFSVGKNIILPVLKSEGVHRLDSIIITHPDIDHYGALLDILPDIKTDHLVSAKSTFVQDDFQSLFPSIEKYGTIIKEVSEGTSEHLPMNTVAVLSKETVSGTNKNNSSLVMLGLIGEKTWLFTGDLEVEGERELLVKYPNLSVDVLKVGHHGSETSTHETFLKQLDPKAAWISSGKNNRYGHPHDSVVEKLSKAGALVYRTDLDGAVRYIYSHDPLIKRWDKRMFSFRTIREQRGE